VPVAETPGSRGLYGFDARVAHPARVYDYWLGGKDNFEADRIAGEETIAAYPAIRASAQANRAFLARTVSYLAADAGIRQFLDLGTGLPTASNTHEVAQSVAPESRVVYVDNDPLVLSHARALLTSSPEGVTAYLDADLRDTTRSSSRRPAPWTSAGRWPSCSWPSCTTSLTSPRHERSWPGWSTPSRPAAT
jgi:hypothetical protein